MQIPLIATAQRVLSPAWLTGPILDKELRVSSRRRRNYLLRVIYLLVLTVFVALVWITSTESYRSGSAYRVSRMSEAGRAIIMAVTWVQFLSAQLLAVVMLSTAISEEIHHRTLAALMSTPITSLQVVLGKLLSKLVQILLLLAISLPVLAVVRVFGGVPWDYVIAGVCVTLTASLFAGSISLLFSVYTQRSYSVIIRTLVVGLVVYALVPWALTMVFLPGSSGPPGWWLWVIVHGNPFAMMSVLASQLLMPRGMGGMGFSLSWVVHCLIMLGFSTVVLTFAVKVVRRTALRQATGQAGEFGRRKRRKKTSPLGQANRTGRAGEPVRRVSDSPVLWRELHSASGHWSRRRTKVFMGIGAGLLALTYLLCLWGDLLDEREVHVVYGVVLAVFGLVSTATACATGIPVEKESRSWPILLSTALSDGEIAFGKVMGAVRRCLPGWTLLFVHVGLFTLLGVIRPVAIAQLALLVSGVLVLLAGLGAYVGSRLRRANAAVVTCFGVGLAVWLILPIFLGLTGAAFHAGDDAFETAMMPNPVVQTIVILEGGARRDSRTRDYNWPDSGADTLGETNVRIAATALTHGLIGVLLAYGAKRRFRKMVF
jgi:ABC-type transport system involved in multi-copper enzyme maturation permease subunit